MALTISGITVVSDNLDLDIRGSARLNTLQVTGSTLLANMAISGVATAPTPATGTSNTQLATTAFVQSAISGTTSGISSNISSYPLNQSVAVNAAPILQATNFSGTAPSLNIGGNAATVTNGVYNNGGTYNINISGNAATVTNGVYNNGGTYNINSSGNSSTATNAVNLVSAGGVIRTTALGTSYGAAIQVREVDGYSSSTRADAAPRLGFHWGGIVASSMSIGTDGHFYLNDNPGTGREDLHLKNLWASSSVITPVAQLVDSNTTLSRGDGYSLRISTPSGWTDVGAQNGGWSHIQTSMPGFYFNRGVRTEGPIGIYGTNNYLDSQGLVVAGRRVIGSDGSIGSDAPNAFIYRGSIANGAEDTATLPGVYTVQRTGISETLINYPSSGSSASVQILANYHDELYFRVARDSLTNWDGASSTSRRILNSVTDSIAANMNQPVRTDSSPTFQETYTNGWFRNNTSGAGLYNQANNNHFYSDGPYWNVSSAGQTGGIRFRNGHAGTILGYAYAELGGDSGWLSGDGAWRLRTYNGGQELHGATKISGNLQAKNATFNGSIVTDSGYGRLTASSGALIGSYNNSGSSGNAANTNPIYVIGSNYTPTDTSLANMYGIGYSHSSFFGSAAGGGWGLYVAAAGQIGAIVKGDSGDAWFKGSVSAASVTSGGNQVITTATLTVNNSSTAINPDNVTQNQIGYNTSVNLFGQTDGGLYSSSHSSAWIHQIYGDFRTGQLAVRGKNSGTWQPWRTVLDSGNFTTYAISADVFYNKSPNSVLGKRRSRIHGDDGTNLNSSITAPETGFTYGGTGEPIGPYIAFGGLNGAIDYSMQLVGQYNGGGNQFVARTRNDDTRTWNPWRTFITDGNYTNYSPKLTGEGATGTWGINISGTAQNITGVIGAANLPNSGATAGSYGSSTQIPVVTVDAKGRVTSITSVTGGFTGTYASDATFNGVRIGRGAGDIVSNTVVGNDALLNNTSGTNNTATGLNALRSNTSGSRNTAIGDGALMNSNAASNTALGYWALINNTTGANNTAIGDVALGNNTSGANNTAVGNGAMNATTIGYSNTAVGASALTANTSGRNNSVFGVGAAASNTTGEYNVAVGQTALKENTSGAGNVALGAGALYRNQANYNIALGYNAGSAITTGANNVIIGGNTGSSIATSSNNIVISDGVGNIRAQCNSVGVWDFGGSKLGKGQITFLSKSGHNLQSMLMNGVLYTTSGARAQANAGTGRGLDGRPVAYGLNNFQPVYFPENVPVKATGGNGYAVTWALLENGNLYTWGYNSYGQCGLGHTIQVGTPTLSATGVSEVYSHPTNGDYDVTYSRLFYRNTSGDIYGCGYNGHGALGIGNQTAAISSWTKITIPGVTNMATASIKLFNLGAWVGCTVILANNRICVSGYNGYGQLGNGTFTTLTTFTDVTSYWKAYPDDRIIDLHATGGFGYYDTREYYSYCTLVMLIKESNNRKYVRTCGSNQFSSLGVNTTTGNVSIPVSPMVPIAADATNIVELAAFGGGPLTVYALTSDYKLYTWGYNGLGQLGRLPLTESGISIPAVVATNIGKLHCDGLTSHTYSYRAQGYVCDIYGRLWSTGYNDGGGYLGDGTPSPNSNGAVVKVLIPHHEVVEEVGHYTTTSHGRIILARTAAGNLYGWGYNTQLGLDSTVSASYSSFPLLIKLPTMLKEVQ